jgi:tetratricopeptide (TPR) repeat protein
VEKLQRELLADPPPDRSLLELRQSLSATQLEIAYTLEMLQRYDQAVDRCQEAIALIRPRPDDPPANRYTRGRKALLASALSQFGRLHSTRQDDPAAEAALKEAAEVSADALKDDPKNPASRLTAARAARKYGDFLLMRNRLDEAAPYYAQDAAAFRDLLSTGELLALKFEHGDGYYRSATLALKRNDKKAADALYVRCRALWADVTEVNPTNRNKLALALVQARLGDHAAAAGFPRKLLAEPTLTAGDGIQSVSVLALCGGAADGDERKKYFAESVAGLTVLVDKLGFKNIVRLKTDPDLDPIRGDPAFQAIVTKLEAAPKGK